MTTATPSLSEILESPVMAQHFLDNKYYRSEERGHDIGMEANGEDFLKNHHARISSELHYKNQLAAIQRFGETLYQDGTIDRLFGKPEFKTEEEEEAYEAAVNNYIANEFIKRRLADKYNHSINVPCSETLKEHNFMILEYDVKKGGNLATILNGCNVDAFLVHDYGDCTLLGRNCSRVAETKPAVASGNKIKIIVYGGSREQLGWAATRLKARLTPEYSAVPCSAMKPAYSK